MAKRELSGTLRNLKFMQRAALREEKSKKEEEVIPDRNFPSSSAPKRCVVIMEGDPHPGVIMGRMSFQGFNLLLIQITYADPNEVLKWKQDHTQYSDKSHNKRVLDDSTSSPSSCQRSKMPHRLDWSVLKPPKSQKRRR
ncbi:unnamed protein product [Withania somnifera]